MEFVHLREADIQAHLNEMKVEMSKLSKTAPNEIGKMRKQANAQLTKSKLLTSELKGSFKQKE